MSVYQTKLWSDRPSADIILRAFTPDTTFLTRSEIAARCGLVAKNKLFIATLESMVELGVLEKRSETLYNGVQGFVYART